MLNLFLMTLDTIDSQSDRDFLVALYQEYKRLVFSVARQLVLKDDAEDIVQEVFIRLIPAVQLLQNMEPYRRIAYICSMTKNLSFNHLAKIHTEQKHTVEDSEDFVYENLDAGINVEDQVLHSERLHALLKIWPELSAHDQYVLRAKYILNQNDREIAGALNVAPASVRMLITRARRRALLLMQQETAEL